MAVGIPIKRLDAELTEVVDVIRIVIDYGHADFLGAQHTGHEITESADSGENHGGLLIHGIGFAGR